jgi:alpha-1,2-glucosyltransferase
MRQTNIFWVAIFLGGLEILRTIRDFRSAAESGPLFDGGGDKEESGLWEQAMREVKHYRNGEIHDVNLGEAGVIGMIILLAICQVLI